MSSSPLATTVEAFPFDPGQDRDRVDSSAVPATIPAGASGDSGGHNNVNLLSGLPQDKATLNATWYIMAIGVVSMLAKIFLNS